MVDVGVLGRVDGTKCTSAGRSIVDRSFQVVAVRRCGVQGGAVERGGDQAVRPWGFRGEPGFTSATANPSITFSGDVQLQIFSRSGKDVSQFSSSPQEREVVFDSWPRATGPAHTPPHVHHDRQQPRGSTPARHRQPHGLPDLPPHRTPPGSQSLHWLLTGGSVRSPTCTATVELRSAKPRRNALTSGYPSPRRSPYLPTYRPSARCSPYLPGCRSA